MATSAMTRTKVSTSATTSRRRRTISNTTTGTIPNAYQQFESTLSPYGAWQDVPRYGHVWVPSTTTVGYDFTPYASDGHWVMSDYGWTWVSDWDWGWAPFHYGRWMVVGGYGWCWLPGTHWGPAWVHWRWGGGYVGWAPMGPRGVVIGAPRGVRSPWRFTVANQLGAVRPHFLPSRAVASVWHSTTPIHNVSTVNVRGTNVRFNAGPSSHLIASATGRAIAPTPLRSVAPRALPNQAITPRIGTPVQSRPWMQNRAVGGQTFARAPQPLYSRPPVTIQHPGRAADLSRAAVGLSRAAVGVSRAAVVRAPQPIARRRRRRIARRSRIYRSPTPMLVVPSGAAISLLGAGAVVPPGAAVSLLGADAVVSSGAAIPLQRAVAVVPSVVQAPSSFHSSPAPSFHGGGGGGFHSTGGFHGGRRSSLAQEATPRPPVAVRLPRPQNLYMDKPQAPRACRRGSSSSMTTRPTPKLCARSSPRPATK